MNEINEKVRKEKGYKIENKEIKIPCYADDAILFAESEHDLERNLFVYIQQNSKIL